MKYHVHLNEEQREELRKLIRVGKARARTLTHARILLKTDQNGDKLKDQPIAQLLEVHRSTVLRVRQHFCEDGLERALHHLQPQRLKPPRLDSRAEAHLIALACGPRLEGRSQWSLRLLADRMVELGHVDELSHETVRRVLKKANSSRTVLGRTRTTVATR
jgi:transposase